MLKPPQIGRTFLQMAEQWLRIAAELDRKPLSIITTNGAHQNLD